MVFFVMNLMVNSMNCSIDLPLDQSISSNYFADDEQDSNPCFAFESESCGADRSSSGASGVRLHSAALLSAPSRGPGLLHQTHFGGQECPIQAVQLRLCQEWQALPQCFPKSGEEGWVGAEKLASLVPGWMFRQEEHRLKLHPFCFVE